MKSERRHELRENDLAHLLHSVRDYLVKNKGRVMLIVTGAVVVLGVGFVGVRTRANAVEDNWRRRSKLQFDDPEKGSESLLELRDLADGTSDKTLMMSCLLDVGRHALELSGQVPDPPDPRLNDMAHVAYIDLLSRFSDNPIAVGAALSGLATVEENAFVLDHDLDHRDRAREYLTRIIENPRLAGTPFQTLAVSRRNGIDDTFTPLTLSNPPPPEETAVDEAGVKAEPVDVP